jgi:hypothetical protein
MKIALAAIVPAMLVMLTIFRPCSGAAPWTPAAATSSQAAASDSPTIAETLIEPGSSIGPLKIGDTRERTLEVFPKKDEDQEWDDACGTTLDWVDASNPVGRGDVWIRLKKGRVIQIESATTRFHTSEGITTFDHPDKVAKSYRELRAYTLLTPPSPALGDRPLVFWVDRKRGIAFSFAYYPAEHKRYVYKIIVFEANKNFCPETETMNSPKWQSIPSYALEPPGELSGGNLVPPRDGPAPADAVLSRIQD